MNQRLRLDPGDQVNIHNRGDQPVSVRIGSADGTEVRCNLGLGQVVEVTTGRGPISIILESPHEPFEGLHIVRPTG